MTTWDIPDRDMEPPDDMSLAEERMHEEHRNQYDKVLARLKELRERCRVAMDEIAENLEIVDSSIIEAQEDIERILE